MTNRVSPVNAGANGESSSLSAPASIFADDGHKFHGLFLAFLALIIWIPLPLGSNRPWAWHIMELATFCLVAIWLTGYMLKPVDVPKPLKTAAVPLFLFIMWLAYIFFQTIPLEAETLQSLSPAAFGLYFYDQTIIAGSAEPLSIDRGATLTEFLKFASYIGIFFLTLVLVNNRFRLRYLAVTLLFIGLGESVYGLVNTLSGIEKIWWMDKYAYRGVVTGTFINRNHFAGHMEMVIPVALGLWLASKEEFKHFTSLGAKMKYLLGLMISSKGRRFIYILVMFSALFLSASRGGNSALLGAISFAIFVAFITHGKRARELKLAPLIVVIIIVAGLWFGIGVLTNRVSDSAYQSKPRIETWVQAEGIVGDYTTFGTGAGTFKHIIPFYEKTRYAGLYDHAHNDYVEILTDQGLIGFAFAASAILIILYKIIGFYKVRRSHLMRGMLFASLVGVVSLLLHSITDFNFQIPANAAYFHILLAIGIVAGELKSGANHKSSSRNK